MLVGKPAPAFKSTAVFPDTDFKEVSLEQYKGKWLVLFSYPLDFTFVCPTEIIEFSNKYEEFKKIGCEVLGLSVDSVFTHLAWINTPRKEGGLGEIKYPLIGDLGGKIAKDYGFYMCEAGHTLRGTAIIDPEGIIRHVQMNHPDVGRNVDEILRLVKAYQFAAKHGEVCPAQWHGEGDLTIKPNPKASKEYFGKANN
ncbi:thioredoxin peroxidase [Trichomonas vaginalis G3]|uniref:Thioredoxin peroxidase n=2 Tax=Trichomonas vaginalis TaxID=5722 RepID=A0A8U0WPW5_TRIV3|nr:thioredoxin peroxidase [Trichomonas vaginalis G3]AAQ74891.1 thioredoxin peroxidase [Trichomonas vaginalis]EAY01083.1 thioredoxin peroxidase [Trichomonas vaginalis G3]KAI5545916.1 thioredoxin peroxidase [Trichomonas vaginalis G3]|eukprot:XP_001330099.1 thioredoxin peroxidase [Trichomonas vaginalis G3]